MTKKTARKKRKRVTRDRVRENASNERGGTSWYELPAGVGEWKPEKKGKYLLDILPYEVTVDNHPDKIEPGTLWFKRPFVVHFNVGPNKESYVCPVNFGGRCPIHEERNAVRRMGDDEAYKQLLRDLNGQQWLAFNILDPRDKDRIAVYFTSVGKFWSMDRGNGGLKRELEEADEENLNFFDVEGGKSLKVRFSEASFAGNKYLCASRFDFVSREDMDEEEILSKTVDLDKIFSVPNYETLKSAFGMGCQEAQEDGGSSESEDEVPDSSSSEESEDSEPESSEEDSDSED